MITMKVAKGMFFDRAAVQKAVDKATARNLSKFGAFVRTRSRSSIRKRKRVSEPGQPPSSHTGLLRQFIFFGYDSSRRSVAIGPVRLGSMTGEALPALEHGGPSTIVSRNRRRGTVQRRKVMIKARPFMTPAFQKELAKIPDIWRDSVKPI